MFKIKIFCIHNRVFIIEARRLDEAFAPCWSGDNTPRPTPTTWPHQQPSHWAPASTYIHTDTNRPPAKSRSGFLHRYNLETILEKSIVVCMRACDWEAENEESERERERESECVNGRDIKKKSAEARHRDRGYAASASYRIGFSGPRKHYNFRRAVDLGM